MRKTEISSINGILYPLFVDDEKSLLAWIESIDRPVGESNGAIVPGTNGHHIEKSYFAHFKNEDDASQAFAKQLVCQRMAMDLFSHLIHAPSAKLIWRIHPEFDVSYDKIPSDLSKFERANGAQIPDGWVKDFTTDTIYQVAAPFGEWRVFKSYMRYSVVIGNEVIYPRIAA